jgi:hypothetical protein
MPQLRSLLALITLLVCALLVSASKYSGISETVEIKISVVVFVLISIFLYILFQSSQAQRGGFAGTQRVGSPSAYAGGESGPKEVWPDD